MVHTFHQCHRKIFLHQSLKRFLNNRSDMKRMKKQRSTIQLQVICVLFCREFH